MLSATREPLAIPWVKGTWWGYSNLQRLLHCHRIKSLHVRLCGLTRKLWIQLHQFCPPPSPTTPAIFLAQNTFSIHPLTPLLSSLTTKLRSTDFTGTNAVQLAAELGTFAAFHASGGPAVRAQDSHSYGEVMRTFQNRFICPRCQMVIQPRVATIPS